MYQLKGELLLALAGEHHPEACFRQALAIARRRQARSLELQAAMGSVRARESIGGQREADEARQVLTESYGWFTEGFGTADLREARALLEASGQGGEVVEKSSRFVAGETQGAQA